MALRPLYVQSSMPIEMDTVSEKGRQEATEMVKEAFTLALLRQGEISAGRATEILGISRWELSERMATYGISPFGI